MSDNEAPLIIERGRKSYRANMYEQALGNIIINFLIKTKKNNNNNI